ncbi:MAG: SCO family protein [Arenimonas sp.]
MQSAHARGFIDRNTTWVLVAALAAGLGLWAGQAWFARDDAAAAATNTTARGPALKTVRLFDARRTIPAFQLEGEHAALRPADLAGHWTVVFLGFTHCPDICPTTLATLAKAQEAWRALPEARRPRVLFVSVDPERDTAAKAGQFARFFHADTLAATADGPALESFVQSLGMVFMKVPRPDGDYMMDHSSTLVVLDPQGRQAGLIRPPFAPADIAADLATLAKDVP